MSRVTVRLALSDLEARGLIFRKHGKGTYAFGCLKRKIQTIGILLRALPKAATEPVWEIVRGVHANCSATSANVLLIRELPRAWSTDIFRDLDALIIIPTDVEDKDLEILAQRRMPYIFAWETPLPGPSVDYSHEAGARLLAESLLLGSHERLGFIKGFDPALDAAKREGIWKALRSVGKEACHLAEFYVDHSRPFHETFSEIVSQKSRPTGVIVADESIAQQFVQFLHGQTVLNVPGSMSVLSFHRRRGCDPESWISSFHLDFFEGGRRVAEVLQKAALTGAPVANLNFAGSLTAGRSVGHRVPATASPPRQRG